jgi:16S rRNA (guanine527-N7)-methyltransferase
VKRKPQPELQGLAPGQLRRLEAFAGLLADRGIPLGVVSQADRARLWDRHILDSLRALSCLPPGLKVADLGAGGGLPGVPIAIARPDLTVHLIEARARRAAFLELAAEELSLANVRVLATRIEDAGVNVDACLARALAGPKRAWGLASGLLADGGWLLYWAGRSWDPSMAASLNAAGVSIEVCSSPSEVWPGSVVKMARTVIDPDPGTR